MDLWTPDFWVIVTAASTFATVLASLLTLGVAAWWRKLDSTGADWAYINVTARWDPPSLRDVPDNHEPPHLEFTIANARDGVAFRVVAGGTIAT